MTESTATPSLRTFLELSAAAATVVAVSSKVAAAQRSSPLDANVWVIAKASHGEYTTDALRWETRALPEIKSGQLLLRTIYLSLDPTLRNWLKLEANSSPIPLKLGDVMVGQTIAVVEESLAPGFSKGDFVVGQTGWVTYAVVDAVTVNKPKAGVPLEANMTIFNHIGYAAAAGMIGLGEVTPEDTVVVSSAAGATGSLAAQIAKSVGARVIGIAGGPDKRAYLLHELGLDGAIDYKSEDVEGALKQLCPSGVTLFFDNVGGEILDAVLMNLALNGRVAICGQIATYNSVDRNDGQGVRNLMQLVFRTARMQGFLAGQPRERLPEYDATLMRLLNEGKLKTRTHIVKGLEQAPEALKLLFTGGNEGKLMIEVSPPSA
jgi:NADPH-dependent curcumin reductase CurA